MKDQEEFAGSDRSVVGIAGRRRANAEAQIYETAGCWEKESQPREAPVVACRREKAGEERGQEAQGQLPEASAGRRVMLSPSGLCSPHVRGLF